MANKTWTSNKIGFLLFVILILLGTVIGGYYFISNKDNVTSNSNKDVSTETNELDLNTIIASLKQKFPTVTETKIYTEENDPNKTLGKPGEYIAGMAFVDSRTESTPSADDPRWGMEGGGSIEVYTNKSDATKRVKYLSNFDSDGILGIGAYKQSDKYVLRVSSSLTKGQQDELLSYLESQVK